jgi:hypothetical protein
MLAARKYQKKEKKKKGRKSLKNFMAFVIVGRQEIVFCVMFGSNAQCLASYVFFVSLQN